MTRLFMSLPAACLLLALCGPLTTAHAKNPKDEAEAIYKLTGVEGGFVVHLGCGDGKLTAALGQGQAYTVHGLEPDRAKVEGARAHIRAKGLYGRVSVEQLSDATLPYGENLVNLVVARESGQISNDEIFRILAPGGVACSWRDGKWSVSRKAWPGEIDDWGHFLHDASNNAVADDSRVGPPRNLQWLAPPLWLRSHETPSGIQASVSSGGRLFYFFDEGLVGITDERLPDRWALVCRDAFNGRFLWKRPIEAWGWRQWSLDRYQGKDWTTLRAARTDVPGENQRRLVADGDRLYVTLGYDTAMSILEAASGKTITTVVATTGAREILVSEGIAVAYVRGSDGQSRLVAVNGQTGQMRWKTPVEPIRPLAWAIDSGRIICLSGKELSARSLRTGEPLWTVRPRWSTPRTILTVDDTVVMQDGRHVAAHDAATGKELWRKEVPPIGGAEGDDLFVVEGLVWRGIMCVDEQGNRVGKSENALAIGWDLRTGQEKKRILVKDLRSPEHHHRCYRNKATTHYLISSYEGAEYLDFQSDNHGQNNWVRGACKYGMMPCNGMLYVPPDQCFCQPGAKLLGYVALKSATRAPGEPVRDTDRLEKGPAYGAVDDRQSARDGDWPTLRHDSARHGATDAIVGSAVKTGWKVKLGGRLTAPVSVGDKVFVARSDAHTLYALEASTGDILWEFTAGGRIDSPPTIYKGLVLVGSKDGCVYCLRASDGVLAWRFLAAPTDRRIACFDQIESAWPVHGSVLVDGDVAYFAAGRSTYLDGGIHLYALEPVRGEVLHRTVLEGPHHNTRQGDRDLAFFTPGANADVLVSEGGYIYMRQKKLTRDLKEVPAPVLSSKGEQDIGLHVFSTAGLLDDSWYNRTFWMYSKRWPGFQLANQASKSGQLLVVGEEKTYGLRVFYRRNVHSPMFFPAHEGYLVFADRNDNEPQIVGEPGAIRPVRWLPQSDYSRARRGGAVRTLESEAFGLDKMIGYTRAEPPLWTSWLPVRIRAMVKAGDVLFVAGAPDVLDPTDPYAAFEGRRGGRLAAISAEEGRGLWQMPITCPPVFDGLIAANGRLFASLEDGSVLSLVAR